MVRASRSFYQTRGIAGAFTVLAGAALLLLSAGCGLTGGELPPLVPADDTTEVNQFAVDLFDSRSGPPCAEVGRPDTTLHEEMFNALNEYRVQNGLQPLFYSQTLEKSADDMARDLWVRGFFAHIDPSGRTPADRAIVAGFCNRYVGENLAAGHSNVEQVMQAWKDSPGHNANMLTPGYAYVGMGHSIDARGRQYWVQEFAYNTP